MSILIVILKNPLKNREFSAFEALKRGQSPVAELFLFVFLGHGKCFHVRFAIISKYYLVLPLSAYEY